MIDALLARSNEQLRTAIDAVERSDERLSDILESLPAPIYLTDANGVLTFYNRACVSFAGRRPAVGKDRWCVSWKLFTEDGAFIPHDQCPMAVAIKTKRPVRGLTAVAKRPDGTRVTFAPLPTPLFNAEGDLVGAVNMLVDVTEIRQAEELRARAECCRGLAQGVDDPVIVDGLWAMAEDCDHKAAQIETQFLSARTLN